MSVSIMGFDLVELCMMFFVYGFLGWCCEVAYAAMCEGRFVNRGFLNGPICPIYGVGVVAVILCLTPLQDNLAILFFGSMVLTSALEFITGWVLEKIFHTRWWDYSERRLNVGGYICLEFSILWGLAATFVMRVIHPLIYDLITKLPRTALLVLVVVFAVIIIADMIATVAVIRNLQRRIQLITSLAGEIHAISDKIGGGLSGVVINTKQLADDTQDIYADYKELCEKHRAEEKALAEEHKKEEQQLLAEKKIQTKEYFAGRRTAESEKLEQKLSELKGKLTENKLTQNRLVRAFPKAKFKEGQEGFDRLVRYVFRKDKKNPEDGESAEK